MKIPRDISANYLIKRLSIFGFEIIKQTGSHIKITTNQFEEYHLTIPNHNPIKVGTLNSILNDLAKLMNISKEDLIKQKQ